MITNACSRTTSAPELYRKPHRRVCWSGLDVLGDALANNARTNPRSAEIPFRRQSAHSAPHWVAASDPSPPALPYRAHLRFVLRQPPLATPHSFTTNCVYHLQQAPMTRDRPTGLVYGDGSDKIFGMENFGNTCYCNLILQCLYFSDAFRTRLALHNVTQHNRKETMVGVKDHNFTVKYELLVQKRLREQPKNAPAEATGNERIKPARKSSLFGLKFNSQPPLSVPTSSSDEGNKKWYISAAKNCDAFLAEQKLLILRTPEFQDLPVMVTRLTSSPLDVDEKSDNSQSSFMLLSDKTERSSSLSTGKEGSITPQSCFIIVGIPQPETHLVNPINPFNPNPSSDHRKRSALINGPIINLDHSLQLPTQQSEETALLYALKDLFECMIESKSQIGVVSPSHFITKLKEKNFLFRQVNMHQDAHEFYNYLLNDIIEVVDRECGPKNNWCNEIFQGTITNETKCISCETITSKEEEFLDLSIDIPPGDAAYSLTHCLNNFSRLETLTHQNKFYCNYCSSLQEATKTIKLKKLPEVLVINFKRFKYDESVDKMVKLFDSISYPFKLRLFNTSGDDQDVFTLYELYALVIHIGGGPMHGHYVALCKVRAQMWFLFDDETVEIVDDSFVLKFFGDGPGLASAYILFYQKVHTAGLLGYNADDMYCGDDWLPHRHDSSDTVEAKLELWCAKSSSSDSTDSVRSLSNSGLLEKNPFKKNYKIEKDDNLSRSSSLKDKTPEKKTWVGGLKRRQSKNEVPPDRKASTGSALSAASGGSEKDRKKGFFGFKRKGKDKEK